MKNSDPEKNISHKENAVINDETAVLSREKSATARENAMLVPEESVDLHEDAAQVREVPVHVREGEANPRESAATVREHEVRAAVPAQDQSDDQNNILQAVNERLITATMKSNELSEKVNLANDQLKHFVSLRYSYRFTKSSTAARPA